jgi:hypothetical protein
MRPLYRHNVLLGLMQGGPRMLPLTPDLCRMESQARPSVNVGPRMHDATAGGNAGSQRKQLSV